MLYLRTAIPGKRAFMSMVSASLSKQGDNMASERGTWFHCQVWTKTGARISRGPCQATYDCHRLSPCNGSFERNIWCSIGLPMPGCCVIQGSLERPVPFGSCSLFATFIGDRVSSLQFLCRLQESFFANHDTQVLLISRPRSGCWSLRVS